MPDATMPTVTALDCGTLRTQQRVLVAGGSADVIEIPVPAWLIRHRRGTVVFDAGLHPSLSESADMLGSLAKLFQPVLSHQRTLAPQLECHDVDPADRELTVVVSHCHFDHVGGLCEVPNARVVVQAAEWAAAEEPGGGYDPRLHTLGHPIVEVDGEHDLFGDRTVVCIPTPGHTCGHQSLRVRTPEGPVLLTADACYFTHTIDDGRLPPFGYDLDQQRRSLDLVRKERATGTRIVPGHDAEATRPFSHPIGHM